MLQVIFTEWSQLFFHKSAFQKDLCAKSTNHSARPPLIRCAAKSGGVRPVFKDIGAKNSPSKNSPKLLNTKKFKYVFVSYAPQKNNLTFSQKQNKAKQMNPIAITNAENPFSPKATAAAEKTGTEQEDK
jgi:hypothetical protein